MLERLQKILARAGVASRRHAEELIRAGAVTVNGRVVTELGTKADPERDHIKVGGRRIRLPERHVYLALHKPAGCVATMSDPEGRPSLRELLRGGAGRVFPVGRLDYHAAGLLLLTSDGELAARLLAAADRLPQTWWLKVKGTLPPEARTQVERAAGVALRLLSRSAPNPWYEARFAGARRDRLRQALARAGHPVEKLKRVGVDGVELGALPPGRYRELEPAEVARLARAAGEPGREEGRGRAPRRRAAKINSRKRRG